MTDPTHPDGGAGTGPSGPAGPRPGGPPAPPRLGEISAEARALVADWPPLTDAQRELLVALLRPAVKRRTAARRSAA